MKRNVLGNGTSQCLLCGEEFGLLGASASECEECSKVDCLHTSYTTKMFTYLHILQIEIYNTPVF